MYHANLIIKLEKIRTLIFLYPINLQIWHTLLPALTYMMGLVWRKVWQWGRSSFLQKILVAWHLVAFSLPIAEQASTEINANCPFKHRSLTLRGTDTDWANSAMKPFAESLWSSKIWVARCVLWKLFANQFLPASLSSLTYTADELINV